MIEFYRTREADEAHAVVGQEMREAVDLDDELEIARQLSRTLDMPQRPDAFTITDTDGLNLCSGVIDTETANKEGYHHERPYQRNRARTERHRTRCRGK